MNATNMSFKKKTAAKPLTSTTSRLLTREFLEQASLKREKVEFVLDLDNGERWPFYGWVHEMTAHEKTEFEQSIMFDESDATFDENGELDQETFQRRSSRVRELTVIATFRDDDGNPLFKMEDLDFLGTRGASIVEPIVNVSSRLNATSKQDIEQLVKNSQTASESDSASDSQNSSTDLMLNNS